MKLPLLISALALCSCTIVDTHSTSHPPGVRMDGLVDGYASFGMSKAHGIFRLEVLDGPNSGSILNVELGNLLGLDVGLLGASFTIGPLHFGLGTLFYSPESPYIPSGDDDAETSDESDDASDEGMSEN
jgi:hypothetical protein